MTKEDRSAPSKPQRKFAGIPFDWRRPTTERAKSRLWNPNDVRFFTPKTFGWGYDINFYWLAHPGHYLSGRRSA